MIGQSKSASVLRNRDIIVFSDDWGRHPFSCQHIIGRLLKYNRVLWVNTIGYRTINLNFYDAKRIIEKIQNWFEPDSEDHSIANLYLINPFCLPFGKYRLIRTLNKYSILRKVKEKCRDLNFVNPILVTTLPNSENIVGELNEALSCYYCVDDFTLWPGAEKELICKLEKNLLSKIDLVIATSENLQLTRKNYKSDTKLLTHGVDKDHFKLEGKAQHPDVKGLNQPTIAYYGLIDERCDLELLCSIIGKMPHITFLLIGEWRVDNTILSKFKNVFIAGKVPYKDLPLYLVDCSALILPYRINSLAESINPLKIKEYIATGLPVISTPLAEVLKLKDFIRVAGTLDSFIDEIDASLEYSKGNNLLKLMSFLEEESWEMKAKQFSQYLLNELE